MRNLIKVLLSIALVLIVSASSAESKVLQARIPLDDIYNLYYDEINDMPVQSGNRYQISLALYLSPSQKDSGPTYFSPAVPLADAIDFAYICLRNCDAPELSSLDPDKLKIVYSTYKPYEDSYEGAYYQFIFILESEALNNHSLLCSIHVSAETGEILGLPLLIQQPLY